MITAPCFFTSLAHQPNPPSHFINDSFHNTTSKAKKLNMLSAWTTMADHSLIFMN